jgi:hypothetical protein
MLLVALFRAGVFLDCFLELLAEAFAIIAGRCSDAANESARRIQPVPNGEYRCYDYRPPLQLRSL